MKSVKRDMLQMRKMWEDCSGNYICDCGKEVYLDSQNEPSKCECGRTYYLSVSVYELVEE